ncbi:unnamed protein product [Heterobilharzia americana]|nr:unnamed protein product [Heterobilharzia americana]
MQFRILIACTVLIIAFVAIELVQETQAGALSKFLTCLNLCLCDLDCLNLGITFKAVVKE